MSAEIPLLTKDEVERAHRLEGATHPLLAVIDLHAPRIVGAGSDETLRKRYLGAFADGVEAMGDFPLRPLDLVMLWSAATNQGLLMAARRDVAIIVALAYAKQGLENSAWRGLPRYVLECGSLPQALQNNEVGLKHVLTRLDMIGGSLDQLEIYVHGRRDAMEYAIQLAQNIGKGDTEALEKFRILKAHQEEHRTPILEAVGENFGTALGYLRPLVNDALESST